MTHAPFILAFLFLTQSEAPKYGVTRASVDPERFDASIETVVYRNELPGRHLVQTWHVMDSKVLLLVSGDRESTSEYFRRQCGFRAWQGGADGVLVSNKLSGPRLKALAEAKADVATCERLDELAEKCLTRPEPVRTEGRRAKAHLYRMRTHEADLDYLRLENVVRAERLAKMLGEPCGLKREVAAPFADTPPAPSFDAAQFKDLKLDFGRKGAELPDDEHKLGVNVAPVFQVRFGGLGEKPVGKPPFPGGIWQAKLWIMTPDGFLPYRYELDLRHEDERPKPIRRPAEIFCHVERRFGDSFEFPRHCPWVKDTPVRTVSPDYPDLCASVAGQRVGSGWQVKLSLDLTGLRRQLPSVTPGREDIWYFELTDPAGKATRARLVWPVPADAAAAEENRAKLMEKIDLKKVDEEFKARVLGDSNNKLRQTSVVEEWTESSLVTGFGLNEEERTSDRAFYETRLKPLLEAKEKSGESVTLLEFRRRVEQARKEFLLK